MQINLNYIFIKKKTFFLKPKILNIYYKKYIKKPFI